MYLLVVLLVIIKQSSTFCDVILACEEYLHQGTQDVVFYCEYCGIIVHTQ